MEGVLSLEVGSVIDGEFKVVDRMEMLQDRMGKLDSKLVDSNDLEPIGKVCKVVSGTSHSDINDG